MLKKDGFLIKKQKKGYILQEFENQEVNQTQCIYFDIIISDTLLFDWQQFIEQLYIMRAIYLQAPYASLKGITREEVVAQTQTLSARGSEPELVQIFHSLKRNFKPHSFKIFDADHLPRMRRKSVSHKKLGKLKLPKLPRILHGSSQDQKSSTKLIINKESKQPKESSGVSIINQSLVPNHFLSKLFEGPTKKRANSDLNPISSRMLSVAQLDAVKRRTAGISHRKSVQNNKDLVIKNEIIKQLNFTRPLKPLSWKQVNFEFEALDEKQFMNMMRAYNYLKVGPNTQGSYKAYLFAGNNSQVVKKCLKSRGCWVILQNYDENAHFVWSQLKNHSYYKKFQSRQINLVPTSPTQHNSTTLQPHKPTVPEQFLANRLGEYSFLVNVQASLQKPSFMHFLNKVVNIGVRSITKSNEFYKITEILERRRPKNQILQIVSPHVNKMHNHVDSASTIGNKKSLFYYMKSYYEFTNTNPFEVLPQTVHISSTGRPITEQYLKEIITFGLPCILKPGENTNRGNGITVHTEWPSLCQAVTAISSTGRSTAIAQKYISPFLYKGRKFDIRVWVLWNGRQAWWYRQGYIRTSSKEFHINNPSKFVHLTNDAVQKHCDDYGKYQQGNKLSFNEFQRHLDHSNSKHDFWGTAYPQMKKIAADLFRVGNMTINQKSKMFGYQLFGLDFMIDDKFKVWLIQANTNPCLETSCTLLTRLISNMIDNVISIAVDPLFPPPQGRRRQHLNFQSGFKFDLLFDGYTDPTPNLFAGQKKFESESDSEEEQSDVNIEA